MANNKNTGTNFEKTQQSHSFPNYGTTADDISVSVPVTFTPTDAARLSKRYYAHFNIRNHNRLTNKQGRLAYV